MTSKRDFKVFFVANLREITLAREWAMSTATKSIKWNQQLPAHSVSIEIYSGIALFYCDSTAVLISILCRVVCNGAFLLPTGIVSSCITHFTKRTICTVFTQKCCNMIVSTSFPGINCYARQCRYSVRRRIYTSWTLDIPMISGDLCDRNDILREIRN